MGDFNRLLEAQIPRLRRYAHALTRNRVRADDLVQETFTRALQKQHLWQAGTDLRAWLVTIMHNLNVNEIRRAARDDGTANFEQCAPMMIAATDPSGSRQLQELESAIGGLPEEQRQVLLLVGLEGLDYEETAALLSIPIGTVRSRLSRARALLRKIMGIDNPATDLDRPEPAMRPAMAA